MRVNYFISITTAQKMQIYNLKMVCLHIWWMQILSANPNTADLLLSIVFICRSICLLIFYYSDLFLLNTWGCNYFFLGEI